MKPHPIFLLLLVFLHPVLAPCDDVEPEDAREALRKAVTFFRNEAGYEGAYLYRVSADLKYREGEGRASRTTGWTEPPGTPFVGEAYLEAHRLTGEKFLLDAAVETAHALRRSQLESGGWASSFELGEGRSRHRYRVEPPGEKKRRNHTTLDDNKSQACMRFLMRLDEALEFKNPEIRDVIDYAFEKFLAAQYPNGAWPQQFDGPPDPEKYPVKKARYPESWSREFPRKDYRGYYTLNDGTMVDMMTVMLEAHRIYGKEEYLASAKRTADFFLLAQMPDPQPGWAQQYNPDMEPAWARKFEPPSLSGGESQGVMSALLTIYRATGETKYLEPLSRALEYYQKSQRPDGKLARFYELQTNKPLYFTRDYQLTYSDEDMPTHYAFIVSSKIDRIEQAYRKLVENPPKNFTFSRNLPTHRPGSKLTKAAAEAIRSLDKRGAWVEEGEMRNYDEYSGKVIDSKTFARNIETLAAFLSAK